jgi:predicted helicase
MNVVFSTYHSIDVIAEAQKAGFPEFDLIICDEAHRTTGATLKMMNPSLCVFIIMIMYKVRNVYI